MNDTARPSPNHTTAVERARAGARALRRLTLAERVRYLATLREIILRRREAAVGERGAE